MLEASSTSGMKAAANGVLNLSILDGWWDVSWRRRSYPSSTSEDEMGSRASGSSG
jgi:starch phosphorylase